MDERPGEPVAPIFDVRKSPSTGAVVPGALQPPLDHGPMAPLRPNRTVDPEPISDPVTAIPPPAELPYQVIESRQQLSDGAARCLRLGILREDGRPTRHASQGETIEIYCQFQVTGRIDVPLGWFEMRDASGRLIHGRSSAQHDVGTIQMVERGGHVAYHFQVGLDVAPGEYAVTVGLSSVDQQSYEAFRHGARDILQWPSAVFRLKQRPRAPVPEEQLRARIREHCRLTASAILTVGLRKDGLLSHDGLVNLPGRCRMETSDAVSGTGPGTEDTRSADLEHPTIVHLTHWKAGSQWIAQILNDCAPDRIVKSRSYASQVLLWPMRPGQIFTAVYATVDDLMRVALPENTRVFVVVRDLRDTLISGYFSILTSHDASTPYIAMQRRTIDGMSVDDGLLYCMDAWLPASAQIQMSCIDSGQQVLRYEDLIADDQGLLKRLLIHDLGLPIAEDRLHQIILANRFERYTAGRRRGEEDRAHHYRKGVAGDWVNYFSESVKRAFKARYGGLLVQLGYEQDLNW